MRGLTRSALLDLCRRPLAGRFLLANVHCVLFGDLPAQSCPVSSLLQQSYFLWQTLSVIFFLTQIGSSLTGISTSTLNQAVAVILFSEIVRVFCPSSFSVYA